jgi:2,3-dihydroxybenzoate-AMP ligase
VLALPAHRRHEIGYLAAHSGAVAYAVAARVRDMDYEALAREVRADVPELRHLLVLGGSGDGNLRLEELTGPPGVAGPAAAPSDVALFLLSGGTTGLPKLIPRTHDDYVYNVRASAELCGFGADTVYLAALPVGHNFPLGCPGVLGALATGGRVVLAPTPQPDVVFPLIEREGVTATAVVPTLALRWSSSDERGRHDLSSLRLLQVGGARLNPEAAARVRAALGCRLQQVFGMAEGLLNYTRLDDPDDVVDATQGRPLSPADEIRIVDEDGRDVAPGEGGELLTRGPYTIRGYYRAQEHNAVAFTADGFYRTGDIVRLHPSGNLVVEGRRKDLINRGGEKISAEEVENLILAHPRVQNVAVVAMPSEDLGERACAYVVPAGAGAPTLAELVDFLEGREIARYKLPERLEVVEALPVTSVGKVDKAALRADVARRLEAEHGVAAP